MLHRRSSEVPPDRSPYRSPIRRPSSKANDKSDRISQHGITIPQIEITRDSSTERGNSFDDDEASLLKRKASTEDKGKVISRKKSDLVGADNYRTPNNSMVSQQDMPVDNYPGNPSEPWRTMITPDRVSASPGSAKVRPHIVGTDSEAFYDNEDNLQHGIRVVNPNPMRLFVALFDYDPAVMSPNADGSDAELPFREGQVIKIFGECDSDGFYKGECNGKVGYVPCNMVTEVKVDDPDVVQQLLKESSSTSSGDSSSTPAKENFPSNSMYMSSGLPVASDQLGPGKRMVALYDYDPQELSPNVDAEVELAFKMGDLIIIYGDMDDDGFFIGEVKGKKGLVPSNFIREAQTPDEEIERASVTQSQSQSGINSTNKAKDPEFFSTFKLNHPTRSKQCLAWVPSLYLNANLTVMAALLQPPSRTMIANPNAKGG
ncbi:Peripheral-type benzodiazepine receptor-associated protein 1,RIMS-binding protein 2 [Acanthosepion pharaonis]|uniref:Peripheral-type benzodiazepine receptor-associated protein 1,RIMS-binding protein 2 n=1 Tax=Acanthosepion pharaonis TaxID=158019 RepID=A0A812DWB6_ACAPH|nr:Peripheral-type benzodiazepine receptor-associated protein 1,RIMS-binding protein 2 [Sepia pharaonis]